MMALREAGCLSTPLSQISMVLNMQQSFEEAPTRIGFAYEKSCAEALESRRPPLLRFAKQSCGGTAEGVPMPERIDFSR